MNVNRCANSRKHTPSPDGYLAWHAWAEKKFRTHFQVRCEGCGRLSIWKRREKPLTKAEVEAVFYPPDMPVSVVHVDRHGSVIVEEG